MVFDDFTHAALANIGVFACLGPEHAGETRVFGYDTRNLRVRNGPARGPADLRQPTFGEGMSLFGPGVPRADKANSIAVKTKTI